MVHTVVLLLLSSALLLLLPLFFVRSVNNILPSLRRSWAVQLVTTKRKNGAAAGGSPSFFVSAWLPLSVSVLASSSVSHGAGLLSMTGRTATAGDDDDGGAAASIGGERDA